MIRGRRPKPAQLKMVTGNPGKRPINRNEPQSPPIGRPPKDFDAEHRAVWREILRATPAGVIREGDRFKLEVLCRCLLQSRKATQIRPAEVAQLRLLLADLGMDPTARARLSVEPPSGPNPFDEFDDPGARLFSRNTTK